MNLAAIVVAAAAYFALGGVWFSPAGFGKIWMELVGKRREDLGKPGPALGLAALTALIASIGLAILIVSGGWTNWVDGLGIGALVGVAFVVPVMAMDNTFAARPPALYLLTTSYHVIGFALMGTILGAWR